MRRTAGQGGAPERAAGVHRSDVGRDSFRVLAHRARADAARLAAGREIRAELAARLGRPVLANVEVRVASGPAEMAALSPVDLPEARARRRPRAPTTRSSPASLRRCRSSRSNLEDVLRHGLAHLALDEAADNKPLPRWFHEGFAVDFLGRGKGFARPRALHRFDPRERLLSIPSVDDALAEDGAEDSLAAAEAAGASCASSATRRAARGSPSSSRASAKARPSRPRSARRTRPSPRARARVPQGGGAALRLRPGAPGRRAPLGLGRSSRSSAVCGIAPQTRAALAASRRVKPALEPTPRASRARASDKPAEERVERVRIDPEVPKVEHDGRWYTLH